MKVGFLTLFALFSGLVSGQAQSSKVALDELLYSPKLWETPISQVMFEWGFKSNANPKFEWLSLAEDSLRAVRGGYSFEGSEIGETIIRGSRNGVESVTLSLFNRGDDAQITPARYDRVFEDWKRLLDRKLRVRSVQQTQGGSLPVTSWVWKGKSSTFSLEGSIDRGAKRPEFIRLSIKPTIQGRSGSRRGQQVSRRSLAQNVQKNDKGDVWIEGIPMVDQGEKGYCVVASCERVLSYYGREVDQHQMARLAGTSTGGTSIEEMEKAFQAITKKTSVRTVKLYEFTDRDLREDVRAYNQAAKRKSQQTFDVDLKRWVVTPPEFWGSINRETLRDVKASQKGFRSTKTKVRGYIDQGIPVSWALMLGLFREVGTPPVVGGHMRLIIGYNQKTDEFIYTDSWGAGHEVKRLRADEAYTMTLGMYAMMPAR